MILKLIGAGLIILGCGGVGLAMVRSHHAEVRSLRHLASTLDYMGCELQYRMTPLPQLCLYAATEGNGLISNVMLQLGQELEKKDKPDAGSCMQVVLCRQRMIPPLTRKMLMRLGSSLGKFDLGGQLKGIENTRQQCRKALDDMEKDAAQRLRNYQTLAICAGVALAILFL